MQTMILWYSLSLSFSATLLLSLSVYLALGSLTRSKFAVSSVVFSPRRTHFTRIGVTYL